jgi:hypothetical protein
MEERSSATWMIWSDMGGMGNVRRFGTYLAIASEYHDRRCDADGLLIMSVATRPDGAAGLWKGSRCREDS